MSEEEDGKRRSSSRSKKRTARRTTKRSVKREEAASSTPRVPEASASRTPRPATPSAAMTRARLTQAVFLQAMDLGHTQREALRMAEGVADRLRLPEQKSTAGKMQSFYDLRKEQDFLYPGGKRKVRMKGTAPVRRDLSKVDMIVVHQTGIEFGVSKIAIEKAGGDIELARAHRALDVACHAMAFRAGYFVAAHDFDVYVNHAGRFNAGSLCLEIEGRYPGLRDDPYTLEREDLATTWGGDPEPLTDATVQAAREALRWLVTEARKAGAPISKIASHRQTSDTRRADPGQEIWQRVVIDFAYAELGLTVVRDSPWQSGRPVPKEWDSMGIGSY